MLADNIRKTYLKSSGVRTPTISKITSSNPVDGYAQLIDGEYHLIIRKTNSLDLTIEFVENIPNITWKILFDTNQFPSGDRPKTNKSGTEPISVLGIIFYNEATGTVGEMITSQNASIVNPNLNYIIGLYDYKDADGNSSED